MPGTTCESEAPVDEGWSKWALFAAVKWSSEDMFLNGSGNFVRLNLMLLKRSQPPAYLRTEW